MRQRNRGKLAGRLTEGGEGEVGWLTGGREQAFRGRGMTGGRGWLGEGGGGEEGNECVGGRGVADMGDEGDCHWGGGGGLTWGRKLMADRGDVIRREGGGGGGGQRGERGRGRDTLRGGWRLTYGRGRG